MSNPRSSRIGMTFALAAALAAGALAASPVVQQPAEASVGAAQTAPRSVVDDTVLGVFSALGEGLDSTVNAVAVQGDDTVYVGGQFTSASLVAGTSNIAAWSNADDTWHSLASGTNGGVRALAVVGDDTVYAGGGFADASGVPNTSRIAAWSNADDTWHALGTGMVSNTVYALALQRDDTLYAGGDFLSASGVLNTRRIAQWSSADDTWHSLASGVSSTVYALSAQRGDLVHAGGSFTSASGVPNTTYVAEWSSSASTWRSLGGGLPRDVYALAAQADDTLYVGGNFSSAGGVAGTQRIAAWSNVDDTWRALSGGTNDDVLALAVDETHRLVYAGGDFTTAGSLAAVNQVAAWDAGIATWLPLQAAGGVGVGVGRAVDAIAANGSVVYLGGAFTTAGGVSASRIVKWTWGAPTAQAVPASGAHGTTIQVRGSRLIGVAGVRVDGSPATYTRDDSTTVSVVIPGSLYDGTYSIQVDAVGGTATTSYTVTGSPAPQPVYPPSEPRDVKALAGNASADVTWSAPISAGSYPVTHYQAVASPGNAQCLVDASAKSCTIRGLSNGTTYSVTVRALNGAGWSAASAASNPVTPSAAGEPTILITGSRSGPVVSVKGTSTGLGIGAILKPWVRFAGQGSATHGAADILVDTQGSFAWQRRTAKTVHVYVATPDGSEQSNTVVIPAR